MAANRDEFYRRPTEPVHRWENGIVAGRDITSGGTWLGVGDGRFAAVTNVREGPPTGVAAPRSRGLLPTDFLTVPTSPEAHVGELDGDRYDGFNLLACDLDQLWWTSNRFGAEEVGPGVHGLSNSALDTAWPKVTAGTAAFAELAATDDGSTATTEAYLHLLFDKTQAPTELLPHTGIGEDMEKVLSPLFVDFGDYGTRACTVVRMRADGSFTLTERRFENSEVIGESTITS
ncbi:NRDE family protein [Rhodococcus sp. NPDC058521]|uniref:NRDE family protein n=1 Tax=Rhodococcus sp. NPDC058521 TaxID=3346536 RepID=UPI003651F7A7